VKEIVVTENRSRKPRFRLISAEPRETIEYVSRTIGITMNKIAAFFARRIGDCLGAIAAGLFSLVIAVRSPAEQDFIYLAVPLIGLGLVSTAIAFTHKG
jgi:hypothetical protein